MKKGFFATKKEAQICADFNNKIDKKNGYYVGLEFGYICFSTNEVCGYCLIKL